MASDPKPPVRFGVRTFQDLIDRCRIDDETGCRVWTGAMNRTQVPVVHWRPDGEDGRAVVQSAVRAAWLLSGRTLEPGHVVWRQVCTAGACIWPAHCCAGTRQQMLAAIAATGRNRGKPERRLACLRSRMHMVKPVEMVRQAEAMFAAGALQKTVCAALGMQAETASLIRRGLHPHSAGRRAVRGSSVFNLTASPA